MRILQLIQTEQYRGAEVFCCQLSNHLMEMGHEVEVVSIFEGDAVLPFRKQVKSLARSKNIRYVDIQGWKKLAEFIEIFKPDVVQANAADTLKYTVISKLLYKWDVPVIYRNASTASFYIKNPVTKAFNKWLLKNVNLIISVSKASKKDLNEIYPFTAKKTCVIPVGIEEKSFEGVLQTDRMKHILHIGSFTKEKNHKGVIEIFSRIAERNDHVILDLVGEGPLIKETEELVKNLNLEKRVNFKGVVRNPILEIRNSEVLILPSMIEGLPGVLLEAMYCRKPVVAYDVGGVSEIVKQETGNLIPGNDQEAFVKRVEEILDSPDAAEIEKAYQMVSDNFTNCYVALKFVNSYEKLVASTR